MKRKIFILCLLLTLFALTPARLISLIYFPPDIPHISNSTQQILLSKNRGDIYDCNMEKLVNRETSYVTVVEPDIRNGEILKEYLNSSQYEKLLECINNKKPFIYEGDCYSDKLLKTEVFKRYSDDGFCCHVLGYINESDNKGVYGIEKGYDSFLKEENRRLFYSYNATAGNRMLSGGENGIVSENYYSQKGVMLTIDYDIQRIAQNAGNLYGIEKGAVVVLDAETGQIRAMVSFPAFNQNDIASSLTDENSPFLNRCVSSYNVGSVFKLVVAATAVKEGKDNFTTFCTSSVNIGDKTFSCSNNVSHGEVDLKKAMAHSCNSYFIRLALSLGSEKILRTAENLGFGKYFPLADGINVSKGNLPEIESFLTDGEIANLSFGQGSLLATPLQVASSYSAVINGGKFIEPRLVLGTVDENGERQYFSDSQYVYRAFSEEEAHKLKEILINDFSEGTCLAAKPDNCLAGGKTSTAETGRVNGEGEKIFCSWFAGFAEKNDKKYTIVVFKEDGKSGAEDCGPVFKEIAERITNNH